MLKSALSPSHAVPSVLLATALLAALATTALASPVMHVEAAADALTESINTSDPNFWIKIVVIVVLVIASGIVAGLALGLMSLDEMNLKILSSSGGEKEKRYAARIMPIRKNGHLLLVTLLLTNTLINESLPVLFDSIFGGGIIAIVVSTALLVIFSEIIPQAVCSRYGLAIGAFFAWPVRILIWILYIIAWPIAKILDMLLGADHGMIYRRAELKELIALHSEHHNAGGDLERDAVTILHGALAMQDKTVREAVTPIDKVFMLKHDEILNRKTLNKIHGSGHSRIPVFKMAEAENEGEAQEEKENMGEGVKENGVPGEAKAKAKIVERDGVDDKEILGVLLVKNLILLDPDDGIPLSHMKINKIPTVSPNMPLFDLLNAFQEGRSHMAVVREDDNLASTNASIRSLPPTRRTSVSSIRTSASIKSFKLRRFLGFRHDNDADSEGTKGSTAEQPMIMVTPAPDTDDGSPNKQKLATPEASLLAPTAATTTMSKVPSKLVGIITLEDVLEELIQEEIYDETDNKKLAALAVKLDAGTGDRYMVASHRLSIKSGHTGAFGTQKQEKHRRRFSEDTTKSLDETEGRKTAIRELREDDERIEIEKENQEKEARKKVARSSSAGSMQVVAEIETEKDDGTLTDDETPQRSRSMRLQRSHTHPGVVSTGDEENEK